jgi:hypothetical protein
MVINRLPRNILKIIADLSHNDVNANILDIAVVEHSDLPSEEVSRLLVELSSLGLIKMLKKTGDEENNKNQYFRILNITRKGLQELSNNTS